MSRASRLRPGISGIGSLSLRAQVALVSGAVAALVAVTLGITYFALLATTGSRQLDRTVARMEVRIVQRSEDVAAPAGVVPGILPWSPLLAPPPLPPLPGPPPSAPHLFLAHYDAVVPVSGMPGLLVALRPDRQAADAAVHRSQLLGLGIGVAGVLVAAVLGWFLAGHVARPLRRLATATRGIENLERLPPLSGRGAREAEELSHAIKRMLARLEAANRDTNRALAGARDFAAVCAHELRTPLTSMRTDLQVLATKELPDEQRRAVLSDLLHAERHIKNTLFDLERLALGELTDPDALEPFELCEILDRAVQDAQRRHPDTRVELLACPLTVVTGLPAGLMLIVTNAVGNAVQHGHAETVTVTAHTGIDGQLEIIIDDDGNGIPEPLRAKAFDRFVKGPGSDGSGLGLALVRQQAELHSGTVELDHSPHGGVRLRVQIPRELVS